MSDKKYNKILNKVKGLLALARDNENDEEGQSAFVLAQRLMITYNINKTDVDDTELSEEPIGEESVTIYKKLQTWERVLGRIIGENFRVKVFFTKRNVPGSMHRKTCIKFYGLEQDLKLAKEMYLLAYECLVFYTKRYIDKAYDEGKYQRSQYYTASLKSSYTNGFLEGLDNKFREQLSQLRNEYEVLVLIPKEVETAFKEKSEKFKIVKLELKEPADMGAYVEGLNDGQSVDFTKKTIGENIVY